MRASAGELVKQMEANGSHGPMLEALKDLHERLQRIEKIQDASITLADVNPRHSIELLIGGKRVFHSDDGSAVAIAALRRFVGAMVST